MEDTHCNRRRSPYWSHFLITDGDIPGRKRATCKYCPQVLACTDRGPTGNLARHIRQKHPHVMDAIEEEQVNLFGKPDGDAMTTEYVEEDCPSPHDDVFLLSVSAGDNSQPSSDDSDVKPTPIRKRESSETYKNTAPVKRKLSADRSSHEKPGDTVADRFDVFGSLVAMKMRELRNDQRILAEKLINDTLHEAEMDNLNRYCGLSLVQVHMVDESKRDVLSVNSVSSNNLE